MKRSECRRIAAATLVFLAVGWESAQAQPQLYAGLIKSKGYVVGSPLSASGLHRYDGDTTWTHIGWNTPRISGIAADPTDGRVLYLASGNGVLQTRDGGSAWRIATDWEITESQDIAVDPNRPQDVYVATAYGIWKSGDGGESWRESNEGIHSTYTQAVAVDREQPERVLAGTWGGIYASEDGAGAWTLVGPRDVAVMDLKQSRTAPRFWAAGTQRDGVLLSRDGGRTWQEAPGVVAGRTIYSISIDPHDENRLAAAGWDTGIFVSTDGGASWERRAGELPIPHFYEVLFDANEPRRLWAATVEEGIYRSDDLGTNWEYAGLNGTLVFDMTFIDTSANR